MECAMKVRGLIDIKSGTSENHDMDSFFSNCDSQLRTFARSISRALLIIPDRMWSGQMSDSTQIESCTREGTDSGIYLYAIDILITEYDSRVWIEDRKLKGVIFHVALLVAPCIKK